MGHNNNNAHALPFQGCVVGKVRKLGVKVLDAQRPCYYGYFHLWGESHPTPVSPQASSPLPTPSSRAPSRRPESSGLIPRLRSGVHQAGLGPGQWQECRERDARRETGCGQANSCFPGTPRLGEPGSHPPALRRVHLSKPRQPRTPLCCTVR